jgi:peptide/nickel transport system substrate-binding protein
VTHARIGRAVMAAGIVVTVCGIAGCGGNGNSGSSSGSTAAAAPAKTVHGGSVTIAVNADPGSLDPQRSVNGPNLLMSVLGYDTPVTIEDSGQVAPQVISSWKPGNDSYVLTVRKGVTCSDGSAMNARVVAENINYVADAKNGSPMAGVAVPSGAKATADEAAGTVTVTFSSAQPFFMQSLAELPLVCAKGLADRKTMSSTTVGSGPYVLSGESPGNSYTYTVRKGYTWGPNGATSADLPTKLTVQVVTSPTTTANELLDGQLNVAQVSGSDVTRLKSAGLYSSGQNMINNEIGFNESTSPGSDVAVRQALIADLDIPSLAKIDTGGLGTEADGMIASPKICAGNTMTGYVPSYSASAAAAELTKDGWKVGSGGIRVKNGKPLAISLIFASTPTTNSATAQYIEAQWAKLGVKVTLNEQSFDQESAVVFGHGTWGANLIGLGVNNPSVLVPFFSGAAPTAGDNFGHVDNPTYTADVAKASKLAGTAGCSDWNAAESALFKHADITPISVEPTLYWGKNAQFSVLMGVLIPTSLRATEG